ncbi:polyprenyl synthetase family protein [Kitasatospora sp. NPDC101157]|uniref:polyprenyl synthetase family protein n=1 Tax=Kitasatospora sp. NPDC101157 TaxID=3364098 RepID=UPI00380EFD20
MPLGEAFPLRDDLLGLFGDPAVTGRPTGDDLREGNRTLLIAHTLGGLSPAEARYLDDRLDAPDLTADEILALRTPVERSGAADLVERRITELLSAAHAALDAASLADGSAREMLPALAEAATVRTY